MFNIFRNKTLNNAQKKCHSESYNTVSNDSLKSKRFLV